MSFIEILHNQILMDSKELSKVASWSQLVTKIQDDKRNAVYSPEASSTQTKIAYQKVNKSKCSFDPIKVVYKDPILEKQYEREKEKKSTLFVEQVTQKKPYNPINHEGELTRFPIRKSTQPKSISRGYHLLSNVSEEEQKNISLTYNDVTNASVSILPLERHKKCSGRPTGRPFNILSNKYIVNDDIIRRGEEERAKERVKETFWDTHHIHVLRGEYYDVKKDKEVQEQTKCRTEAKSRQQLAKLPPRYANYHYLYLCKHCNVLIIVFLLSTIAI